MFYYSDFFGALRARVYDDEVRKWISEAGIESIGKKLVNSKEGPPTFEKPAMTTEKLLGVWKYVGSRARECKKS